MPLRRISKQLPALIAAVILLVLCCPLRAWAACASPAGNAGDLMYNADYHVPQYCDGASWKAMGKPFRLLAYWKLDDGSGTTAADSSGNGYTGTLVNTPTWAAGQINGALGFNGTTQYGTNASFSVPTSSVTVSAWAYLTDGTWGDLDTIVNVHNGANLGFGLSGDVGNDSQVQFWASPGGICFANWNSATSHTYLQWHLYTQTYDNGSNDWLLYVDGVLKKRCDFVGTPNFASLTPLMIGTEDVPGVANLFKGTIDEVRIYDRALSAAEVKGLYNYAGAGCTSPAGSEGEIMYNADFNVPQYCDGVNWQSMLLQPSGLVGWWKLDDGSGTSAADSSGNGNTGALNKGTGNAYAVWTGSGQINGALTFNGTGNDVITAQQIYFNQVPLTASAWFYLNQLPSVAGYINSVAGNGFPAPPWGSWVINVNTDNKVYFNTFQNGGQNDIQSNSAISAGTWYHAVGTIDSNYNTALYLNGVKQTQTASVGSLNAGSAYIAISATTGGGPMNGTIDDVRVYDRLLSAAEIANQYAAGTGADPVSGLIHHWALDEAPGATTAVDSIGGANATLQSPASFTTATSRTGNSLADGNGGYAYLTAPADILGKSALTLSAWMKTVDTSHYIQVGMETGGGAGNEINIQGFTGNVVYFCLGPASGDACYSAPATTTFGTAWHLFTLVFDGTQTGNTLRLKGYIDGVQQTLSGAGTVPAATTATMGLHFDLGSVSDNEGTDWGYVDDIRIYNRALNAAEVAAMYNAGGGAGCSSPEGNAGDIVYNSASSVMQYCNGATETWVSIGG